eukprot:1379474-Rhodomonas_salina.2
MSEVLVDAVRSRRCRVVVVVDDDDVVAHTPNTNTNTSTRQQTPGFITSVHASKTRPPPKQTHQTHTRVQHTNTPAAILHIGRPRFKRDRIPMRRCALNGLPIRDLVPRRAPSDGLAPAEEWDHVGNANAAKRRVPAPVPAPRVLRVRRQCARSAYGIRRVGDACCVRDTRGW